MRPITFLLAVMLVFTGWQLFPNGPLAYYVLSALALMFTLIWIATRVGRECALVALYGALQSGMTAACGGMYASSMDGFHYLCDRGTGLPVSGITLTTGLLLAAWLTRSGRNRD